MLKGGAIRVALLKAYTNTGAGRRFHSFPLERQLHRSTPPEAGLTRRARFLCRPARSALHSPEDSHLVPEGLELLWGGVHDLQNLYCNVSCK